MRFFKPFFIFFVLLLFASPVRGLVLTPQKIAYVDIEQVYENIIMVDRAREEIKDLIDEQRLRLEESEENLKEIRESIEDNEVPVEEREKLEERLEEKEKGMEELGAECSQIIEERESAYRQRIMGEIYDAVTKIARRGGYTAVLDGEVVFFTGDSVEDISSEVIDLLNEKRPEN
ncbi:MAG: OmpH family outer membrane protein [Elusimicrobiota bacterium]